MHLDRRGKQLSEVDMNYRKRTFKEEGQKGRKHKVSFTFQDESESLVEFDYFHAPRRGDFFIYVLCHLFFVTII